MEKATIESDKWIDCAWATAERISAKNNLSAKVVAETSLDLCMEHAEHYRHEVVMAWKRKGIPTDSVDQLVERQRLQLIRLLAVDLTLAEK